MAVSPKFASGRWAWGVCDRCGIRSRFLDLRFEFVMGRRIGLKTCPTCWDLDHEQNFLPKFIQNDPQALRDARPDTGAEESRILLPPGNWINGHPPSRKQLEEAALEMEAERVRQHAIWRQQMEAQRLRQRSF